MLEREPEVALQSLSRAWLVPCSRNALPPEMKQSRPRNEAPCLQDIAIHAVTMRNFQFLNPSMYIVVVSTRRARSHATCARNFQPPTLRLLKGTSAFAGTPKPPTAKAVFATCRVTGMHPSSAVEPTRTTSMRWSRSSHRKLLGAQWGSYFGVARSPWLSFFRRRWVVVCPAFGV